MYSTAVDHDGHKLGYIRLVNFGQHAALDMQHAVQKLQACLYMACCPRQACKHADLSLDSLKCICISLSNQYQAMPGNMPCTGPACHCIHSERLKV